MTDIRREPDDGADDRPVVLITGVGGSVGTALVWALEDEYRVVGMDLEGVDAACDCVAVDLTSEESTREALSQIAGRYGRRIASVVHLAAYFDFSGEPHPLYDKLNVDGTRHLLRALKDLEVEQFVYSGTMLVHRPGAPGERIDETAPIEPKWAYPNSKAAAERAVREEHGDIPCVLLRLAGLYDEQSAIPTLSQQIARIYERRPKAHAYSADLRVGQSVLHKDDMVDAFRRTIDRRGDLTDGTAILIGEPDPMGYDELQRALGLLTHGASTWRTLRVPAPLARFGAWLQLAAEPVVPDAYDRGLKPFIRPFMVEMGGDHYALDIGRARDLLGWTPSHDLRADLPRMIDRLKADPGAWYRANGITPPEWLRSLEDRGADVEAVRERHERRYRAEHAQSRWAGLLLILAAVWLIASPPALGLDSAAMAVSDVVAGLLLLPLAVIALSWRHGWARWAIAPIGLWLLFAPLVFRAPTAAGYLNDTLVGAAVLALAVAIRPTPGISPAAVETGPLAPPGWNHNPSAWVQRLPIVALAFVGFFIARYLAAYQLGHVEGAWDPFFGTGEGPNGTERVMTSAVSRAFPVPDAGLGAMVYLMEAVLGVVGGTARWRTMPWVVALFGLLIVPLGVVSVTFIIIQPIVIGTWCALCLVQAGAMLVQMAYALNEVVATGQFLARRRARGKPVLRVLFAGDTDDGPDEPTREAFDRPLRPVILDVLKGGAGVSVPSTLGVSLLIGVWLMTTRLTVGAEGAMADADHLIGALVVTVSIVACAEVARALRFANLALGAALLVTPFLFEASGAQLVAGWIAGLALIGLSLPKGRVAGRYGGWQRFVV